MLATLSALVAVAVQGQVGTWSQRAPATGMDARTVAMGVWTGQEFIVWGGEGPGVSYKTGGRYSPVLNQWSYIDSGAVLSDRSRMQAAVWTGQEMLVWGGYNGQYLNDGARYSPQTDTWTPLPPVSLSGRYGHITVWTGTEMIVWGGFNGTGHSSDGAAFNPTLNQWRLLPSLNAPTARSTSVAVWSGTELILWGGGASGVSFGNGARYHPSENTWQPISTTGAPPASYWATAVWTGTEMIVWGGRDNAGSLAAGGRYNPATDTWQAVSMSNAPAARDRHVAVWTGGKMIVWGGFSTSTGGYQQNGGVYDPVADSWSAVNTTGSPVAGTHSTAVWTGQAMLVFGGYNGSYDRNVFSFALDAFNDGITDAWREQHFGPNYRTDPRAAANADPDGDGASNLQEFANGSNPVDPLSGFQVGLKMSPTIVWRSVPSGVYRILRKESLTSPNWTVVAPAVFTIGTEHTFVDQSATNTQGFYLVEPVVPLPSP